MKASIDGVVVADAPKSDLVSIEGNYYFPPRHWTPRRSATARRRIPARGRGRLSTTTLWQAV